eukprot:scaffold57817_cov30-Tisochrysis_lutea.AAC.3
MVKAGAEEPFVQLVCKFGVERVMEAEQCRCRREDDVENSGHVVEDDSDTRSRRNLGKADQAVLVVFAADPAAEEDAPGEESVHRGDIIEHVLIVHRHTHKEDKKVEAPHHLHEAWQCEVGLDVVVREVAESGHPHVCRNEDADSVIYLRLCKVMVEDEHQLHPALPLLRLVALQRLCHRLTGRASRADGEKSD